MEGFPIPPGRRFVFSLLLVFPLSVFCVSGCLSTRVEDLPRVSLPQPMQPSSNIPYRVKGVHYYPLKSAKGYAEKGVASWYGAPFHGQLTSNKEVYNMNTMTAAHRTLPFNTWVKVVNRENNKEVVVRINDRGPFVNNRAIDLSRAAAKKLGMLDAGTTRVRLSVIKEFPALGREQVSQGPAKNFSVQIGVFKSSRNADKIKRRVRGGWIQPFREGDTPYFRVLVGTYRRFEPAVASMDAIRQRGYPDAFIVQTP